MAIRETITARLKLDHKEFTKGLKGARKDLLVLGSTAGGLGASMLALTKLTANYQDETIKTARAAGSTAEEFSALRHAGELSNVPITELRNALLKLNEPTNQTKEEFKRLGIEMTDGSGKLRGQTELLGDLADKYKGLQNPVDKSASALTLFGEAGSAMVNLLEQGSDGIQKMKDEAVELGLTFSTKAGQNAEEFNDNLAKLGKGFVGIRNKISESIIQFVNQSGVMQALTDRVKGVIRWWNSLEDSTKENIIQAGLLVATIGGLVVALVGIMAVAPAVGAAVTLMTGPIGLAIAATAALAFAAAKYWDKIKGAIQPAVDQIVELLDQVWGNIKRVGEIFEEISEKLSLDKVVDSFTKLANGGKETSGEISILGTVAKVVFKAISVLLILVLTPLKAFAALIGGAIEGIYNLGRAAAAVFRGDFDEAARLAKQGLGNIVDGFKDGFEEVIESGRKIKEVFEEPFIVEVDVKGEEEARKKLQASLKPPATSRNKSSSPIAKQKDAFIAAVDEMITAWKKLGESTDTNMAISRLADLTGAVLKVADITAQKAGVVVGALGSLANAEVEAMQQGLDKLERDYEVRIARLQAANEAQMALLQDVEEEKLQNLKDSQARELELLKSQEDNKVAIVEQAANERLLVQDKEFQAAKAAAQAAFEEKMEQEREQYELEKEFLLEQTVDNEQRKIEEAVLKAEFDALLEGMATQHDENLATLASDHATKVKGIQDNSNKQRKTAETSVAKQLEKLQTEHAANLQKAEEDKNKKLQAENERAEKEEEKLRKEQLRKSWEVQKAQLEATRGIQIAETWVSGISAAAQAYAALAPIPVVGPALGAAAAAVVMEATRRSANNISNQKVLKPAELKMEQGGVLAGPRHSGGGIQLEAEGGEGFVDRLRTEKFLRAFDSVTNNNQRTIIFRFEQGAIVLGPGHDLDDEFIEMLFVKFAERIERTV